MTDLLKPIKADYSQAWVRGWEHIAQEGTSYWQKLREERGWSREDVWHLTDGYIVPPAQEMFEAEWGPCMPDRDELEYLAIIYGRKPGELLDECYEQMGRVLLAEDDD